MLIKSQQQSVIVVISHFQQRDAGFWLQYDLITLPNIVWKTHSNQQKLYHLSEGCKIAQLLMWKAQTEIQENFYGSCSLIQILQTWTICLKYPTIIFHLLANKLKFQTICSSPNISSNKYGVLYTFHSQQ